MNRPQAVVAYLVRGERLLVFVHADQPLDRSGVQVPAGTVRRGELPEDAVLREVVEETGLTGVRIERYLGSAEYDVRPYADAVHVRNFYHLSVGPDVPDRWYGEERDGDGPPIRYELYWLPLAQAHVLAAGQGALIGRLLD